MATQSVIVARTPEQAEPRQGVLPDPRRVWSIFRKHVPAFAIAVVLVMSALLVALLTTTHIYRATSSVLVEPRKLDPTGSASVVPGLPADTYVVDTQTRVISSAPVALRVVRDLGLANNPAYNSSASTGAAANLKDKDKVQATPAELTAMANVLRRLNVKRSGLTYVIDISADAAEPELAASIANSFARNYISATEDAKRTTTAGAARYVQDNADVLRQQALKDDAALHSYMVAHNLLSADGMTLAERQISDLDGQIAQARATLAQEQGRYNAAQSQVTHGGGADVNAVLSSDTIRSLRAQEAQASAQLASLQGRYGDLYPDVVAAKDNLASIRAHIADERDRILSGLRANVAVAQSGLNSLQSSYERTHGSLAVNNSAMVGLQDLQRKADASKEVYSAFLQRAKEIAAQEQSPMPDASISSLASDPKGPIWPNYPLALSLGLFSAIVAGMIAVAAAEYLDGSVHNREDLEARVGIAYAGAIPDVSGNLKGSDERPEEYILSHPYSLLSETMRNLGAYLTLHGPSAARVIAITSSFPREGKTTLAICLARTLLRSGRSVVLVDGDFRRFSASQRLVPGMAGTMGQALSGQVDPLRLLGKDAMTELAVLSAAGEAEVATGLSLEAVSALYERLKEQFDYVIVDTAPVLGLAETRVLARAADATVLAARWRRTSAKAVQAAASMLRESRSQFIVGVLTLVNSKEYSTVGQGDSYIHHKRFSAYYLN
jgi:uncharacterized protein involved in exopolysaccharide biosynthesis/Mrp family chromosome partitioning ATPase